MDVSDLAVLASAMSVDLDWEVLLETDLWEPSTLELLEEVLLDQLTLLLEVSCLVDLW